MPKPDKPYDPTIRFTVRGKDGTFYANAYDTDGETEIPLNSIEPKSKGRCLIRLSSIYVINGKFGWTWDLETVWLTERPSAKGVGMNANLYGELPPSSTPAFGVTPAPAVAAATADPVPAVAAAPADPVADAGDTATPATDDTKNDSENNEEGEKQGTKREASPEDERPTAGGRSSKRRKGFGRR